MGEDAVFLIPVVDTGICFRYLCKARERFLVNSAIVTSSVVYILYDGCFGVLAGMGVKHTVVLFQIKGPYYNR